VQEGTSFVTRQENLTSPVREWKYSAYHDGCELAYIRGHFDSPKQFHISRVENTTGDDKSGFKNLSKTYRCMEDDLRAQGVEKITTRALLRVAHIAVGRYGLRDSQGRTQKQLKKTWLRKIPCLCASLEKYL
jgi:hypothetical protein